MDWKQIYTHLKESGFDVYPLGQHKGECTKPYLVLRANGAYRGINAEQALYELLLYYPADFYYQFEDYISEVKRVMNELYPALKLIEPETIHYLDPDVNGFMTSLTYGVIKTPKINRI